MLNIILCTGLPGSGKSVYCDITYTNKVCSNFVIQHLDNYLTKDRKYNFYPDEKGYNEYNNFNYTLSHMKYNENNTIVIDGLYLTYEERKKLLLHIIDTYATYDTPKVKHKLPNGKYNYVSASKRINIQEIYWKENREACLSNDMLRNRHILAQQTILNAKYDNYIPNDFLSNITNNITINDPIFMEVAKYSNEKGIWECEKIYNRFKNKRDNISSDMIVSEWKDTDDPDISHEFEEFDTFIENICPEITFMQYKRIKKLSNIKINQNTVYDYYGTTTIYNRYEVNINDIKDAFINSNIPCKL